MDNLEEMYNFQEIHSPQKLNQEETNKLNVQITIFEIENVKTKKQQQKKPYKSPGPDGFTGEFYQICKVKLISIFLKLSQKTEEETLPKTFSKPSSP